MCFHELSAVKLRHENTRPRKFTIEQILIGERTIQRGGRTEEDLWCLMNGENTACFYPVSPFLTFNLDQLSCILGDVNALLHNTIDSYNRLYMDGDGPIAKT